MGSGFGGLYPTNEERWRQEYAVRRNWHGAIGAVEFDLRHSEVDPAFWQCPRLVAMHGEDHGFVLAAGAPGERIIAGGLLAQLDGSFGEEVELPAREPAPNVLFPGDRVFAHHIKWHDIGDDLDHPADRRAITMQTQIERANGDLADGATLVVFARGSRETGFDRFKAFDTLTERLCALAGVASVKAYSPEGEDGAEERAFALAKKLKTDAAKLKSVGNFPQAAAGLLSAMGETSGWDIDWLLNEAAMFGFLVAEIEGARHLRPKAEAQEASHKGAQIGGKKSAATRAAKAKIWQALVDELLPDILSDGFKSLDRIAVEIDGRWKKDIPACPSNATLRNYLQKLRDDGRLRLDNEPPSFQ